MTTAHAGKAAHQTAIVLLQSFNAHATGAFIDPLRAANYLDAKHLFSWQFFSLDGGPVSASNGMVIETLALDGLEQIPGLTVVSSSWTPEAHQHKILLHMLKAHARSNVTLCGLDTGAFVLGFAGLLNGYRVTVHYEHIDAFQELFPGVEVTEELFVIDRNVITCCGGSASIDLALHLIQIHYGIDLANAAARYIFHDRKRCGTEGQNAPLHEPVGYTVSPKLRQAIVLMERNLELALPIPEIASSVNLSQRQLERLFRHTTGQSAARYYLDIRLDRARGLITQTDMRVVQVAVACGFVSAVHFSKAYKRKFGLTPRQDRVAGRVPFEFRAFPMHAAKATTSDILK
ncbi:MAG: GlxA family transcriptional regulator [Gammaproteobacteria bacterium]